MKELPTVFLNDIYHKGLNIILIRFSYNKKLIALVKSIQNSRWSKTHSSWYLPCNLENLKEFYKTFKGITHINTDKLSLKLQQKLDLTISQKKLLNGFYLYLKGKRYSSSTIKTYTFFIADFILFYKNRNLKELTNRDVEIYIEQIFLQRKYSVSSQRQFISALKLFVKYYPEIQIEEIALTRPKRDKKLPNVLSQEEVLRLIQVTKNIKHRAIIALVYSCGLRIGELINLKLEHIDIARRQLLIKNAKGRKDRYVVLANSFIPLLKNYVLTYRPKYYFVEGQNSKQYSASSVRKFLKANAYLSGITKEITPHTLRHSYATHLLENGVGLRHIQELLGHVKPETTMIYTHVAKKDLLDIQSPLDKIVLHLNKNDKEEQNFLLSGN